MAGKRKGREGGITIIKREEIIAGGHHGGAWKVAYADFVTAMMAFFLLMWLLNATTEDQRKGIADFFSPSNAMSRSASGSGKPFGGRSPFEEGNMASDRGMQSINPGKMRPTPETDDPDIDPMATPTTSAASDSEGDARGGAASDARGGAVSDASGKLNQGGLAITAAKVQAQVVGHAQFLANAGTGTKIPVAGSPGAFDDAQLRAEMAKREKASFDQAAQSIRDAIRNDPGLTELADQLAIDQTPEGLRIQLHDEEKRPMFATGSAVVLDRARLLLQSVVPVLKRLTQDIAISGHTDAAPFKGPDKSNWELSADRANATRRIMIEAGMAEGRIRSVTGNADRDPLLPADPLAAANRRIAITVLRSAKLAP